jgi:uncharacterized oligopeptide transporter (OPT) family protein
LFKNIIRKENNDMIFWIFVIVLLISIGMIIIGNQKWDSETHHFLYWHDEHVLYTGLTGTIISAIIVVLMLAGICEGQITSNANSAKYEETYKALTYKLESGSCRDELGLLSKSVIDEIQAWNEDVVSKQKMQNNFWVGIFYPDIYDNFETIDYTHYKKE